MLQLRIFQKAVIKITRISGNENAVGFSFIYLETEWIWGYLLYSCFIYLSQKHSEKIIYSDYSWVKVESVYLKLYGIIKSSFLQDKEYPSKCTHCLDIKNAFIWTIACQSSSCNSIVRITDNILFLLL